MESHHTKATRLSAKGQVILPKAEETPEGVLLRPLSRFPETRLEDVVGCLKYTDAPKTISQMKRGIVLQSRSGMIAVDTDPPLR